MIDSAYPPFMSDDEPFRDLCRVFEQILDLTGSFGFNHRAVARAIDEGPLTAWEADSATQVVMQEAITTLASVAMRRGILPQFELALRGILGARLERLKENLKATNEIVEGERSLPDFIQRIENLSQLRLWRVTASLWEPPLADGERRVFPDIDDEESLDQIPQVARLSLPVALLDPFCDLLEQDDSMGIYERGADVPMLRKACGNQTARRWSVAFIVFLRRFRLRDSYSPRAAEYLGEIPLQLSTPVGDLRSLVTALHTRLPVWIDLRERGVDADIEVLGTVDGTYRDEQDDVIQWWCANAGPGGRCSFNLLRRDIDTTLLRLAGGIVRGTVSLHQVR